MTPLFDHTDLTWEIQLTYRVVSKKFGKCTIFFLANSKTASFVNKQLVGSTFGGISPFLYLQSDTEEKRLSQGMLLSHVDSSRNLLQPRRKANILFPSSQGSPWVQSDAHVSTFAESQWRVDVALTADKGQWNWFKRLAAGSERRAALRNGCLDGRDDARCLWEQLSSV